MAITEKSRKVLKILRDPTSDLIAGIAGVVFAGGNTEPYPFQVLAEEGELTGTICRFDYETYYTRGPSNDWVVHGLLHYFQPFKLVKKTRQDSLIEVVYYSFDDEREEDLLDWQDVVWTI